MYDHAKQEHYAPELVPSDGLAPSEFADAPERVPPEYLYAKQTQHLPDAKPGGGVGSDEREILGLRPRYFWALILLMAIVLAAAIGGGVGAGLASRRRKNAESTSIASSGSFDANTPQNSRPSSNTIPSSTVTASTAQSSSGCNETDRSLFTPSRAGTDNAPYEVNGMTLSYRIFCYENFASADSGHNPGIDNLPGVEGLRGVSSLHDCISLCASYNVIFFGANRAENVSWGDLCSGAVYVAQKPTPTCWLQNGTTESATSVLFGDYEVDSAVLQWPS
ncbi:MAG: hypothetical protein M1817_004734 [Caeruleum heppii]|nr:MAG: hypothetical protein M1817_004734 [Caeruleum heppii]